MLMQKLGCSDVSARQWGKQSPTEGFCSKTTLPAKPGVPFSIYERWNSMAQDDLHPRRIDGFKKVTAKFIKDMAIAFMVT